MLMIALGSGALFCQELISFWHTNSLNTIKAFLSFIIFLYSGFILKFFANNSIKAIYGFMSLMLFMGGTFFMRRLQMVDNIEIVDLVIALSVIMLVVSGLCFVKTSSSNKLW
ncbi:hypothetical protein [Thalassotalea aquiviva]|uniref:hypothetical protein n=1 Tax=Thalassotalea aquiviva TaxID=3242415 RepID=UPI00352A69D5